MSIRCLLVEDEYFTRDVLSLTLRRANFEVEVAENGQSALDYLKTHIPDIVLVDLHMPIISGYEVINSIRSDDRLQNTMIVIITANPSAIRSPEAQIADVFMTKPLDVKSLISTIEELVSVSQS